MKQNIKPAQGKLAVLLPGMGAVATTFIAGVMRIRKGLSEPVGSLTQLGTARLGKRTEDRVPKISELVDLAGLDNLVFGGWDIFSDDCYTAARTAGVLDRDDLEPIKDELAAIRPMPAVFDQEWVKRLTPKHVKSAPTKWDLAQQLIEDIHRFIADNGCDRAVAVWCGSTEVLAEVADVHETATRFEAGLKANDERISPAMIYAYAHIKAGVPYANGAPNVACDLPAIIELAVKHRVPIAGKDFKTGQTLMKTILGPGLKARLLGLNGWYSTNILGNRDGEVLDDPGSFKSKESTKLSVLDTLLQPDKYPQLYGNYEHKVRIDYYPPRGDSKEGWDNIDIFGWLGYPMQIKINFLCRDSILAAPVVLDLVLFMDLSRRAGFYGIQEWLSFYFKCPQVAEGLYPEHDLFIQLIKLKNTLRHIAGEELVTHLGLDYYYDN